MKDEKEVVIEEEYISQLIRGERPEGMDYEEFRIKRKALNRFLKQYRNNKKSYRIQT